MENFRNCFSIFKCTTENCVQIVFPWLVQKQNKMIVHKYFHPVCKVSLYIQPIWYVTLIMFLCGNCCLLPKHALYMVKQELQRKTSKTIFIFLLVGVKSALKKYLSCLPHFCYILVSEPVYNFEGRRMAAVYNVGEEFSATHLLSYSIIRPNFPKYNFNSESCSKFPTLPFFSYLTTRLSSSPSVITLNKSTQ